ncbi:unnamed protein product [Effrenium voratum]|nr:unnamed protein product [Effrenium voratum]
MMSLHLVTMQGHHAVAQCLLEAGADENKGDNTGSTPLHFAALQGHRAVARCLLEAGAEQKAEASHHCTLLLRGAIMQLHSACWKLVLTRARQATMAALGRVAADGRLAGADKDKASNDAHTTLQLS